MKNSLIIGKIPPPYYGTSVWTEILHKSGEFEIFDTNLHKTLSGLGKIRLNKIIDTIKIYFAFSKKVVSMKPAVCLVPLSQSTVGFIKDSIFILIANRNAKKTLAFLHGGNFKNWYQQKNKLIKWYVRFVLKKADGACVLGEKLKSIFDDFFDRTNIYVIPNGIDCYLDQQKNHQNHKKIIRLLYIGNLQPTKGIIENIKAISLIKKNNIPFEFNVIGKWRDAKTKHLCEYLVAKDNLPVNFLGPKYNQAKYDQMQKSDIFIFTPNAPEGHPFVIIEAMAAGLPIISTDQGAITESVIDGVNGFIVKPNAPAEIAIKIQTLLNDITLRKDMSKKSYELYNTHFTQEKMIANLKGTFNLVLNTN